jgi:hypothetical protein
MSRTLVVVLCQTRAHELTFGLFKKNVIDHLGADLCFCGAEPTDIDNDPLIKEAKYTFMLKDEPEDSYDLLEEASQEIIRDSGKPVSVHWSLYIKIPGQEFTGGARNKQSKSSFLLYYRWLLLKKLREHDLLEEYDRFVITRSDYMWPFKHVDLDLLSPSQVWVPDGEYYGGVTDRHTVLSRHNIEEYLNIFNMMVLRSNEYISMLFETTDNNGVINPEVLIKCHLKAQSIKTIRTFPYNMFTVRARDGPTSWSTGSYNENLGYCVKYRSEFLSTVNFCYKLKKFNKTIKKDYYKFDADDVGTEALENVLTGIDQADDTTEYYKVILKG